MDGQLTLRGFLCSGIFMGLANALYWLLMIFYYGCRHTDYGGYEDGTLAEAVVLSLAHSLIIKTGAGHYWFPVGY